MLLAATASPASPQAGAAPGARAHLRPGVRADARPTSSGAARPRVHVRGDGPAGARGSMPRSSACRSARRLRRAEDLGFHLGRRRADRARPPAPCPRAGEGRTRRWRQDDLRLLVRPLAGDRRGHWSPGTGASVFRFEDDAAVDVIRLRNASARNGRWHGPHDEPVRTDGTGTRRR